MNIIKIEAETYVDTCPEEYSIKYLGSNFNIVYAMEGLEVVYNELGEKTPEWSEMVRNWLGTEEKVNKLVKSLQDWYIDEEDLHAYETLEDFFYEAPEYFITEIIDNQEKAFDFFEANDIQFGGVGYSPWSFYIAPIDVCSSFIQDLWEGWYFYKLSLLDENGEAVSVLSEVYMPDTESLREAVDDFYRIKDFYLVDNQEATYMKHKKVKEIKKVDLSYKIIL